jgi:1,4-dihydroxy-2-naphthoate octaprenyltransferase
MIDVKMWGRALEQMPRPTQSEWQQLDPVAKWLIACRASVLFMTFTAAALGGLMAWRAGAFHWDLWFATVLGLMFAHATNNLLNDYTDSRRGIDKDNYYRNQYGVHVLEDGLMSERQFWRYLGMTAAIALLFGGWIIYQRSGLTLNLMLAGAFFVLFYTWPLKYYGLGEPAVLLVWGPLMVGGTYYVLTGTWSADVAWLSTVFALGPTTVLFGKHTDKLEADRGKGVHTLPVIVGEQMARRSVVGMICAQYGLCLALVLTGSFSWPLLLVFLNAPSLPALFSVLGQSKPESPPAEFPADVWPLWFSAFAFNHTRRFTLLFLAGVILDTLLY